MSTSRPSSRRLPAVAAAATAVLLAMSVLPAATASATSADRSHPALPGPVSRADALSATPYAVPRRSDLAKGPRSVFVQLAGRGAADLAAAGRSPVRAKSAVRSRRATVRRVADAVLRTARAEDPEARRIFEVSNALPGVGVVADGDAVEAMARRSDVVKVSPLVPKKATNAGAVQLTRTLSSWRSHGGTGRGVTIGVVDFGLDYTHADFGGRGTTRAYDAALAAERSPGWRSRLPALARAKIAGGYDFAGNDYDADATGYRRVPKPDTNPIDCGGHGTHVAGTAAGYGVTRAGKPFTGSYRRLTGRALYDMRVGPGTAPRARLVPLKVFGCTGSTELVIPALDRALDPDGDGDFSDHLDVVNLSLGSDLGAVDDPESEVVDELSRHGVLSVASAGNVGDLTDAGSSPGTAESALTVASSVDPYDVRDGLRVDAPASVRGTVGGLASDAYDWAGNGPSGAPVSGTVTALPGENSDGCDALSGAERAAVAGKVAWLEWTEDPAGRRCGSVVRSQHLQDAGAVGAVLTSDQDVFPGSITGDEDVPVVQLPRKQSDRLRPRAAAGTLEVTFDGRLLGSVQDVTPSIADIVSSFSSRGAHGSLGSVKPDVTAPGESIASAGVGSGQGQLTISGTSMSAPHAAGIAALLRAEHPRWSPLQVKAAIMNGAVHDVRGGPDHSGATYGPARVGAGRVDAEASLGTSVLAYSPRLTGRVSASFGPVPVAGSAGEVVRSRSVVVQNTGRRAVTVALRYQPVVRQPGVVYSVSRRSLTVPARSTRRVRVLMTVTPTALRHRIDPTMSATQRELPRQFVPDGSGRLVVRPRGKAPLRVPVYGAAKPASETTATAVPAAGREGQVVLTGRGVDQGTGSRRYASLFSVLELGERSGALPVCVNGATRGCTYNRTTRSADLRYVGAGSTDELLWFGVATRAQWASVGTAVIPFVDYDVDGDDKYDFQTYAFTVPDQGGSPTDVLCAVTVDYANGAVVDVQPVNFNFGDVDTNVFDTDVLMLPVSMGALGLGDEGSHPIWYRAATDVDGFPVDHTGFIEYDAGAPDLVTEGGPLFRDEDGAAVGYSLAHGSSADALVLHLHGLPGRRAEVLDLTP